MLGLPSLGSVEKMFWFQLLSASVSPARFGSSSGETAGGEGCWQHADAKAEDEALLLQQSNGLGVPLLLPPGHNLGQHTQVGFENTQMHGLWFGKNRRHGCRVTVGGVGGLGTKILSLDNVFVLNTLQTLLLSYSKTTSYGIGSFPTRRRRSTSRCACANSDDKTCNSFCLQRWAQFFFSLSCRLHKVTA